MRSGRSVGKESRSSRLGGGGLFPEKRYSICEHDIVSQSMSFSSACHVLMARKYDGLLWSSTKSGVDQFDLEGISRKR